MRASSPRRTGRSTTSSATPSSAAIRPRRRPRSATRRARRCKAHLAGAPLPPPPSAETVRRMMDFVAGADIPEHYAPFLMEELAMSGADPKRPRLVEPEAEGGRGAAAGGGDRRRHVGPAGRHPPEAGRHPLHDRREERRRRRHLVGEHLSRLPGRQPQPPLFLLVRAQPRVAEPLLDRSRCCWTTSRASPTSTACGRTSASRPQVEEAAFDEAARDLAGARSRTRTAATRRSSANAVITAVGQLNQPRLPDIAGRRRLQGPSRSTPPAGATTST